MNNQQIIDQLKRDHKEAMRRRDEAAAMQPKELYFYHGEPVTAKEAAGAYACDSMLLCTALNALETANYGKKF